MAKRKKTKDTIEGVFGAASRFLQRKEAGVKQWVPSSLHMLDLWVSHGRGIPLGRLIEFSGESRSGKSFLALKIASEVQKKGGDVLYLDAEGSLDTYFAEHIAGVNMDENRFFYTLPPNLDATLTVIEQTIQEHTGDRKLCIILDSVAGLATFKQSVEAGALEETKRVMGSAANSLSWFCSRGCLQVLHEKPICLIFLNQTRTKVDFFSVGPPKKITTGGAAIGFYSRLRIETSFKPRKDKDKNVVGKDIFLNVIKNSYGVDTVPTLKIPFYPSPHKGVCGYNEEQTMFDFLVDRGKIKRTGSWYEFASEKKFQTDWVELFRTNDVLRDYVKEAVTAEFFEMFPKKGAESVE